MYYWKIRNFILKILEDDKSNQKEELTLMEEAEADMALKNKD